jgi:hypothetical protein
MITLQQLLESLTLEQAEQCERETDKLIWIETVLLDPVGLSRRHAETVDLALEKIYWDFIEETQWEKNADRMYSN